MNRDSSNDNDSGWVFRKEGYSGTDGTYNSLYQIASAVPAVIPFLALPPNSNVERTETNIIITTPSFTISAINNAFLAKLMTSPYQELR